MRCLLFILILTIVTAFSSPVLSKPITFNFSGTASGKIGTTDFSSNPFIITSTTDTDNIYLYWDSHSQLYDSQSANISILGIGVASFTEPTRVYFDSTHSCFGFNSKIHNDLLSFCDQAVTTWDFKSSIGPILNLTPYYGAIAQFQDVSSSLGAVTFQSASNITFSATIDSGSGSKTPVPVMDGWWLLPGLLAGVDMFARRRKK